MSTRSTPAALAALLLAAPLAGRAAADPGTPGGAQPATVDKARATSAFGVRLGGLWANGTQDSGVAATGGGVTWFFDARALFLDVAVDGAWSKGSHQVTGGFGGYLPFGRGDFAPYAGGGLRLAWTDYGHEAAFGLQPYAEAGMVLGRYSSASLRAGLGWWWNTFSNDGLKANGGAWFVGVQF
jgi:hypothetical protein